MTIECPGCKTKNPETSSYCADCGTPLEVDVVHTKTIETPTEELKRGSIFAGRYEIIEELGKGGMGRVYRVEDKKIKKEIALKLIKPEIASDKKTIERFKNELTTARDIRHKNVCGMFDLGEEKEQHYITMEYVSGGDLKRLIRRVGQLPTGKAIFIAKQICDGLEEAHSLGVVHRDLKPNNIMIDNNGNARIMDFGIARTVRGKGITGSGVMIGTPEYMSPEQVEAKEVDQRSDIYSLGIIMYEMLTGRLPFEADTPFAVGVKHKSETPKSPKEYNSQISDDLNRVILKCLEKEKVERYASAEKLRTELDAIEKGIPSTEQASLAKKTSTSREVTVTFQKRRVLAIGIFIIIAVSLFVLFILNWSKNEWLMVLPFENVGDSEADYLATGISREITNRLNPIPELNVKAYTTAVQCAKTEKTIPQIREELNVDYVVNGTMHWDKSFGEKGQIMVSWELIKTSNEILVDSGKIEIPFEDISGVQGQVAEEIVKALDLKLLKPERDSIRAKPTDNPDAFDSYLLAEEHFTKASSTLDFQEYEFAVESYNTAVELDPDFILAWSSLSYIQAYMYYMKIDSTKNRLDQSYEAIQTAIGLDPDNPYTQLHLAYYYFWGEQDLDRALKIYKSVEEIRPNITKNLPARIYREQGKYEEAIQVQKDQFDRDSLVWTNALEIGMNYAQLRQFAEAEIWYDRSLKLNPENFTSTALKIINSIRLKGHTKDARILIQQLPPNPRTDWLKMWLEWLDRNYEQALETLENLKEEFFVFGFEYFSKNLSYAQIFYKQGNASLLEAYADSAHKTLKKLIQETPDNPNYHSSLGLALAFLGNKEEALYQGNYAIDLCPISESAELGPGYVFNLVRILILIGDYGNAIDKLELLLSKPTGRVVSEHLLRIDPWYDPLRDHPRFNKLLEKYAQ